MKFLLLLSLIPLLGVQSRVLFPEELVSFLSFVYSVIPPVKIGQDSRVGAGFRVGPNADFQILLELGPQSETQSLGPDGVNTRDARTPNLRKSLKSKKHNFQTKNKTLTEAKEKPNSHTTEDNSTVTKTMETATHNFTESS
ncbi:uncharacterized protein LOC128988959 [Macrosteles quadrilineatus]|uniref:uncharacterized protein LOC128988959 n=1 Tax=Macrosteles quadrilineatus TaxID=74068 RepID=UPI0023E3333B|nr:uncharacterized protein LOC128988959 [Macrosteles quadrilineatus]